MAVVSMKHLFEAGAHLGHKTRKWHPKMKEYIYGAQSGIYIIDIRQTLQKLKEAYEYVKNISANGGKVLFVGTKFQAREIIQEEALKSNNFFVNFRWLGGMLTNFNTIKQSILKLKKLEEVAGPERDYVGVLKKEAVRMERERKKLQNVLGGITELRKKPAAIFISDINREFIALNEAKVLGIPIIATVDTNCDPRGIDYPIPGNDDSKHCIKLFASVIAAASIEGRKIYDTKITEMKREKDAEKAEEKRKEAEKAEEKRKREAAKIQSKPQEKKIEEVKVEEKAAVSDEKVVVVEKKVEEQVAVVEKAVEEKVAVSEKAADTEEKSPEKVAE